MTHHHQFLPDPALAIQDEIDSHQARAEGIGLALGIGFGILVGLCAGLLVAPKPGKEILSELEEKVCDLKSKALDTRDLAAEKFEAARERILEAISSGKTRAAEILGHSKVESSDQQSTEERHQELPVTNSETLSGNPNLRM